MENTIKALGGNRYELDGTVYDFDGMTVVSNEEYNRLEERDELTDDIFAPMHSEGDKGWEAVAIFIS